TTGKREVCRVVITVFLKHGDKIISLRPDNSTDCVPWVVRCVLRLDYDFNIVLLQQPFAVGRIIKETAKFFLSESHSVNVPKRKCRHPQAPKCLTSWRLGITCRSSCGRLCGSDARPFRHPRLPCGLPPL